MSREGKDSRCEFEVESYWIFLEPIAIFYSFNNYISTNCLSIINFFARCRQKSFITFSTQLLMNGFQNAYHSVLVLFLTQTKSSEAETFFSISYDAKQVRISWENHLSTGFPLSYSTKSIITVARAVQNLGRNWPLPAGQLNNSKFFFIKLAQTYDEQMVKISERYLKPLLSNSKLTKFHWSR